MLHLQGGMHRRTVVSSEEASLRLQSPIRGLNTRQDRVTGQMLLEFRLIKFLIVEGAEGPGQATQGADQLKLWGHEIDDEAEAHSPGKRQAILDFRLHFGQTVSCAQQVVYKLLQGITDKSQITRPIGGIEGATDEIAALQQVSGPRHDEVSESQIRAGLMSLQAVFFDQIITELTETESGLVVAEPRSRYDAEPFIGETRRIAVAMLEAQIDHAANDE